MLNELRMVPGRDRVLIVGTNLEGEIILKARLPTDPAHPRAAISFLEGLALWSGRRLPVVVGVNAQSKPSFAALLPDGPAWWSPLVEIHVIEHPRPRRKKRLDGVGDFRKALQLRFPVML